MLDMYFATASVCCCILNLTLLLFTCCQPDSLNKIESYFDRLVIKFAMVNNMSTWPKV